MTAKTAIDVVPPSHHFVQPMAFNAETKMNCWQAFSGEFFSSSKTWCELAKIKARAGLSTSPEHHRARPSHQTACAGWSSTPPQSFPLSSLIHWRPETVLAWDNIKQRSPSCSIFFLWDTQPASAQRRTQETISKGQMPLLSSKGSIYACQLTRTGMQTQSRNIIEREMGEMCRVNNGEGLRGLVLYNTLTRAALLRPPLLTGPTNLELVTWNYCRFPLFFLNSESSKPLGLWSLPTLKTL